ncbi:hypothetical protein ACRN9F_14210 [Shewanella oncorhynchi]|uniref:hypothetical protein n=1 Tax=Shewanella oncorhynchi TaxID=2726434 RepID=UPI003D7A16CF
MPDKNVIPPMTNPMGKGWTQPKPCDIELDDTHALMSKSDFDRLPVYSWSYPSGVYPGKMWAAKVDTGFQLRWFGNDENGRCQINSRSVLIA